MERRLLQFCGECFIWRLKIHIDLDGKENKETSDSINKWLEVNKFSGNCLYSKVKNLHYLRGMENYLPHSVKSQQSHTLYSDMVSEFSLGVFIHLFDIKTVM